MTMFTGSAFRHEGVPIDVSITSGSEFTVMLMEGPGYLTLERKRDENGFYTFPSSFASHSSSNMVSSVFSPYIIGSYMGPHQSGSLTFTAAHDVEADTIFVKVASPVQDIEVDMGGGAEERFVISVKTDNAGTSNDDQFTLPWIGTYDVDWGDGVVEAGLVNTQTHTYASAGTYDVKVTATTGRINFSNTGDKDKLLDIKNWGTCAWTTMSTAFYGCNSLTVVSASDTPNLSSVPNSLYFAFSGCSSLTSMDVSNWDVSNVTTMEFAFRNSPITTLDVSNWNTQSLINAAHIFQNAIFSPDISNWNMSNVTNVREIVRNADLFDRSLANWDISNITNMLGLLVLTPGLSTANYDATLISWAAQTPQSNINVNFGGSEYTYEAVAARQTLIDTYGWTITDGGQAVSPEFVISVKTDNTGTSNDDQFSLPWIGTYDVDWGDGVIETGVVDTQTHTYASAGTYDVKITAATGRITFNTADDPLKLVDIKNWGTCIWTDVTTAFRRCTSLTSVTATDAPNLSNVNSLSNMFWKCRISNADFSNWDVSSITDTSLMFSNNGANGTINLSNWDVSNVTNMYAMFYDCDTLQITGIENWNTNSLTSVQQMFKSTRLLDASFANWNINSITNLSGFLSGNASTVPSLSTSNYDATLISWANQNPSLNEAVGFGESQYTLGGAAESARNTLINTYGWTITDGGGQGVLDIYSGAAAAYSLRDLATASVGSAVVRVRRSSDNTEQDFTAEEITDGTLTTFTGANDGFVTTWYDQSGNSNDASQSSASYQPKLVSSGVVELDNGKPCLNYDTSRDDNLDFGTELTDVRSVFQVLSSNGSGGLANFLGATNKFDYHVGSGTLLNNQYASASVRNGANYVNSVLKNFTNTAIPITQTLLSMISVSSTNTVGRIAKDRNVGRSWQGNMQEVILYNIDQTSNRTGIETNINDEYTIY